MKYTVKYCGNNPPKLNLIHIKKIRDGIYFVFIDFFDKISFDATGTGEDYTSLYFTKEGGEALFEVAFDVKGFTLTGGIRKKTFQGTFYRDDVYDKLFEGLN